MSSSFSKGIKAKYGFLLVVLVSSVTGCQKKSEVLLGPDSEDQAVVLATRYMVEKNPTVDISHEPATAKYFKDNSSTMADGGPFWTVSFAVPASKDKDGKIIGVRKYTSLTIYLDLKGNVVNEMSHTP